MLEFGRILLAIPIAIGEALYDWLTHDDEEAFIAEQRARFLDWASDQ